MTNTNGIIKYGEGAMELIQHFSHPHPLLLSLDGSVLDHDHRYDLCGLCKESELPHQLKHPLHPKHDPLTLINPVETTKSIEDQSCNSCGRFEWWYPSAYTCSGCTFNLCIKCASLSLTTKVDIHDHPLTLMQKSTQFICDHCEKEGKGMFYFCAACSFMVHPECTLSPLVVRPPIIKADIHDEDHPLTLVQRFLISLTCNACGNDIKGRFYFCDKCSFVVHLECASLPSVVKVIRHDHPLNLIYSLPAINPLSLHSVCQLCVKMVDIDYGVYYCSTCDFVAHLHCATSKEEKDETFMQNSKDEESIESSTSMLEHGIDESTDMFPYVVKKFKPGVDGIEIAAEIKHFSHEHDLKLTAKFGINEKCDACTRYIFTPYYACAQCRFFLHKHCAELSRRMRHPLHRHPLMLLPRATYDSDGSFGCDACRRHPCNGFTYNCEECLFNLDVQCSLLPYNKFTHDSHEHGLIFSRLPKGRKCNNCDSDEEIHFCCADNCGFALDFKCLTMPHTMWYEQHEHPFTLCYAPEDDSGEYYCDICEKERDPRCWFYYCTDCIYPAHPECILGRFPNIKFGKTHTIDNHQHPLAFVHKTSGHGREFCKVCVGRMYLDVVYECAKCNFIVHKWCLDEIGTSKG
ncbi:uncharacterized protein LOC121261663 isoform X2 [Juglans microcarpa x Juglans regia]|uniref:uncharacterized protein LOC121261663 isoform X2 n=1 Tax=Juglans microcarpa x Juglans regia TaxID=2249226 RepID=UPI001B7E1B87|nr:uncharacterized protein LOC121261663 isoform X2 [Juglans microcarpa x Juglans regia]